MRLDGRHILVTGAARGIGLAIVGAAVREGASVMATDSDAGALLRAADRIGAPPDMLRISALDVGCSASIEAAMEELADWPALDGLVNNAAILDISDAGSVTDGRFAEILNINLMGALRVTRAALPHLRQSTDASIVNTLSTQCFFAVPRSAAYASAKGGLHMLTRSMAVDFG
ncbi:MAG: SDR family NAD(P)-dependent oxidoreductase, partial [Rhodobacteraceae bacterium]|nr:SDR family NAD(P)-dependent oxidoreductase [Paracoccaceae bacterium]